MTIRNLEGLLAPKSVALIGASPGHGSVGATIARNLITGGFAGSIGFANPRYTSILDRPCVGSIAALPFVPDLAVIATPPSTIPGLVEELAQKGTRAVVVISAGLDAETKQRMQNAARPKLVRILGPNSVGLLLPSVRLNASFAHRAPLIGDLAFLSQSGALVTAVIDWASGRNIGFSHVVSLGDMTDVDFGDMLDYLAGDTASRAILLYMEAVTHAPKFMSAARRAARAKPVVVIKSGRHAAAARAAQSHTGRLAGQDVAYDAAFRRAGLLRVRDLAELFEAAEILSRSPRLTGERLAILTNGGGAGVLAADHLADHGGTLAELASATIATLDKILPPTWSRGNPIDIIGDADPDRYAAALEEVLADPESDAVLAINCPTALASSTDIAGRVVTTYRGVRTRKALITNWLGDGAAEPARALFAQQGIPTLETPGAAVRGFMHLVEHARAQDALMRTPPLMSGGQTIDEPRARAIIGTVVAAGGAMLSEADAKALLATYGIPVAASVVVETPAAAESAAANVLRGHAGVALKILSPDITHKSDVGGVHLDLASPAAVRAAAESMLTRTRAARPDARLAGFTLSPMVHRPDAHELIVGMSVDATFGPLVMFGAGGTAVEVIADTALALPPLDHMLARDLIGRTRVARLLAGYRNRKPADMMAIADVLVRIGALACTHPEIREIDINPLLADDKGVIALDARIRIAGATEAPRAALSIKPYPAAWEKRIIPDAIGAIRMRPVRPEDEVLYESFFARVSPEDRRLRFFAAHGPLSHKFLARLTQIDYAREIAFIALSEATGELLGVSRFAADPDYDKAEFAVLVRSDLKGKGLGWSLMKHLIDYARATGLKLLYGSVLAENTSMLKMCRELGFHSVPDPEDLTIRHFELEVRPG